MTMIAHSTRRRHLTLVVLLCFWTTEAWITLSHRVRISSLFAENDDEETDPKATNLSPAKGEASSVAYDLGLGKNLPKGHDASNAPIDAISASVNWMAPTPVDKPPEAKMPLFEEKKGIPLQKRKPIRTNKLIARTEETTRLRGAVWDEEHYQLSSEERNPQKHAPEQQSLVHESSSFSIPHFSTVPALLYPNIDLSIPSSIYSETTDAVWELMRYEAYMEAQREPLLVSFLYSTILNHDSLESALAFHLANRLSSPAMISTQIQSLILEALRGSHDFRRSLRADIMAVRDRDPACTCLPDVFLYFKGFHALQAHRVAHYMYKQHNRQVLAHYLQSQVSQNFQIDIHPNATLGAGIMLDHGTGIVIGETATVGHNCSILHHVTLGGSGKKGVDRHPKVGNGVLLGAGASVLGNVNIGDGCQVGAGTLVISDLPAHSVAVGVPAKIIGSFVDVTEQPSIGMNQLTGTRDFDESIITFASGGI